MAYFCSNHRTVLLGSRHREMQHVFFPYLMAEMMEMFFLLTALSPVADCAVCFFILFLM